MKKGYAPAGHTLFHIYESDNIKYSPEHRLQHNP